MTQPMVQEAQAFCDAFNADYEVKHEAFERQFWGTKMALANTDDTIYSSDHLSQTKNDMENLLSDPEIRRTAERFRDQLLASESAVAEDSDLIKTLNIIIRTCTCYDMSFAPEAKALREECSMLESQLEMARNKMKLGYTVEGAEYQEASSVGLRNLMCSRCRIGSPMLLLLLLLQYPVHSHAKSRKTAGGSSYQPTPVPGRCRNCTTPSSSAKYLPSSAIRVPEGWRHSTAG